MHIPDNFLSPPVWASLDAIALPTIAAVSRRAQQNAEVNNFALLGVMGAFIFAAQMINFPVGFGTSGHLVGGTLLAAIFGPWAASLVLSAILIIQALVFQDGGVLALGPNIINMAIVGVWAGYLPVRSFMQTRWKWHGVFLGGACSVLVCGVLALAELRLSGNPISSTLLAVSLGLFAINAIAEGAITVSVLKAIERVNPEVSSQFSPPMHTSVNQSMRYKMIGAIAIISIVLATAGIIVASTLPDGIEHLAKKLQVHFSAGFILHSPLRDYQIQLLGASWLSRVSAGLIGLLLVYFACAIGSYLLTRTRRSYS
ncbi:MAG: energy-coupling factor ABC transporter permease [Bryobacteraceae bacterium]